MYKRSCIKLNVLGLTHMTSKGRPTHRGGLWVMVLFANLVYVLHALLNEITFNSVTKCLRI